MILGYLILVLPFVAVLSALVYIPYVLYSNHRYGKHSIFFHLAKYALIGCIFSLIYLTVLWYYPNITFSPEYYFLNLHPFIWVSECYGMGFEKMIQQLILNIGMFVPYGFLLPLAVRHMQKFWKTAAVVFCTTVMIETLQYFMGRSADIDDVIMNFIGGVLGYLLFMVVRCFGRKRNSNSSFFTSKESLDESFTTVGKGIRKLLILWLGWRTATTFLGILYSMYSLQQTNLPYSGSVVVNMIIAPLIGLAFIFLLAYLIHKGFRPICWLLIVGGVFSVLGNIGSLALRFSPDVLFYQIYVLGFLIGGGIQLYVGIAIWKNSDFKLYAAHLKKLKS